MATEESTARVFLRIQGFERVVVLGFYERMAGTGNPDRFYVSFSAWPGQRTVWNVGRAF